MIDASLHLDLIALKELEAIMGDDFSLLIDTFTADSILRLEGIKAAISANDAEAIRRAAHNFKGSTSNMAAPLLTKLCRDLEELGYRGETIGSEQLHQNIIKEYELVKSALESL
jgi:HPt (histidine-containing phosphotransfer) domain-containing protein